MEFSALSRLLATMPSARHIPRVVTDENEVRADQQELAYF